jgi:hypothetical protein
MSLTTSTIFIHRSQLEGKNPAVVLRYECFHLAVVKPLNVFALLKRVKI